MQFGVPSILPWLVLVVVLAWWLWLYRRWQSQTLRAWASARFLRRWGIRAPWWHILLGDAALCLGITALLLALARPQWGWSDSQIRQRGMELVVVLDVSPSMYLPDVQPTRWHRAVFALHAFAEGLASDRIALVAFDGEAGLQAPFTDDVTALRELAWYTRPGLFPSQGQGLAAALALARQQLQTRKRMHDAGAVIVLSDGDTGRTDAAIQEAKRLQQHNISLFVVSVGSQSPPTVRQQVPGTDDTNTPPWLRQTRRRLPPWQPPATTSLRKIAQAGGGSYGSLTAMGSGLQQVRQALQSQYRKERSQRQRKKPVERYPIALGLAALFLALHRILQT